MGQFFFISDWIYFPDQFTLDLAKRLRRDFSVFKSSYHFANLSTTHGAGFTLSLLMLNVKQGSSNPVNRLPIFTLFCLTQSGIEPEFAVPVANALSIQPLIGLVLFLWLSLHDCMRCV